MARWRNGSALLSGSKGCGFESHAGRLFGIYFLNSRVMVIVWMCISAPTVRKNCCLLRIVFEVNHLHSSYDRFCNILIALL